MFAVVFAPPLKVPFKTIKFNKVYAKNFIPFFTLESAHKNLQIKINEKTFKEVFKERRKKWWSQLGILSSVYCFCFEGNKFININIAPIQYSAVGRLKRNEMKKFCDNFLSNLNKSKIPQKLFSSKIQHKLSIQLFLASVKINLALRFLADLHILSDIWIARGTQHKNPLSIKNTLL